ncbi:hypothetical protein BDY24DRAFT_438006 [Mrakia frigida]|uniref:uncharacterized protein n=1 Tax=Mrakia frigida TaxID=29902 RepID=UPI003FCC0C3B
MPSPTLQDVLEDLRIPGLSMEEAEDVVVELIEWRKVEGVERWKVGRELEGVNREIPLRLLPALSAARERTLFASSAFSPIAFSTSSTRLSVSTFLAQQGLANPGLSREVLLEYVARKERIVRGWPGGVRAGIEVVQGGLRDLGIELGPTPLAHLVEKIQLETGHISLSQLMSFLRSFSPPPPTREALLEFETTTLPGVERSLKNWAQACLLGGGAGYEVGVELQEIRKQIAPHLHPIFPSLLQSLHLPPVPRHPHAHGLASLSNLILPAIQQSPDPEFVTELLMEWVGWERRRTEGAWGRRERAEMGGKLVGLERVKVRFETRCPPFDFPPPPSTVVASTPYQITTSLSLLPRTMSDLDVERMLQKYVDGEREKVGKAAGSSRVEGGWGEVERKRVGDVLEAISEKLNDNSLNPIFEAVMLKNGCASSRVVESSPGLSTPSLTPPSSLDNSHSSSAESSLRSLSTSPQGTVDAKLPASIPSPTSTRRHTSEMRQPSSPPQPKRRQSSEPSSKTLVPGPSILVGSKNRPTYEPFALVVSEPDAHPISPPLPPPTIVEPPPAPATTEAEPTRPAKSSRRFSIFSSKPKVESPEGEEKKKSKKDKEKAATVASKKGPAPIPKSVSTPKSNMPLTSEDIQLRSNTEANKQISLSPNEPSRTISSPSSLARRSVVVQVEPTPTLPPFVKSASSLSFADSVGSSTSSTSNQSSGKKEKHRPRVLVKAQKSSSSSVNSSIPSPTVSAKALSPKELKHVRRISDVAPLGEFLTVAGPSAMSSTGDLQGRLEKSFGTSPSSEDDHGTATPRPRKVYQSDSFRPKSMVDLSTTGEEEKKSRRFSFFSKKLKADRFPSLDPIPGNPTIDDDLPRGWSRSTSSLSIRTLATDRPRSSHFVDILDSQSFPDFTTMRAPHQLGSSTPPTMDRLSSSYSNPTINPRQQWRSPAQFASSGHVRGGTSTPPIAEVDSDRDSTTEDPPSSARVENNCNPLVSDRNQRGMSLMEALESDPGHGGLIVDEEGGGTPLQPVDPMRRVYQLMDSQVQPLFDLTRKIDPPAPTPPLPSTNETERGRVGTDSFFPPQEPQQQESSLDELVTPPLSPRLVPSAHAATATPSTFGRTPSSAPPVGPISPSPTPINRSPVVAKSSLLPSSLQRIPSSASTAIDFGVESSPALAMMFSPSVASPAGSPIPLRLITTASSAPKRALPGVPPPSPITTSRCVSTSAGPLSPGPSSPLPSDERVPPILTVRAVFEALSPTEHHSTGKVLDILMGFIDREREQSIALNRKKGWGETERTKVGWIIGEVEAELVPTNPHLSAVIERVRILTDCPPQSKAKKRSSKQRSRSATDSSSSSISSLSSVSSTATSASISSLSTDASGISESSINSDATGARDDSFSTDASRTSSDSDETVTHHGQPSHPIVEPTLDRNSSTRTVTARPPQSPTSPSGRRPFRIPRSSFDHDPSSPPLIIPVGTPTRSKTIHGSSSSSSYFPQAGEGSSATRTSLESVVVGIAAPPPPYERARRTSSLRIEGSA